jgi:integrase
LLKYAKKIKAGGHIQLFPTLIARKSKESYSHDLTNWFSRGFIRKITEDKQKVFHSFRHGFVSNLNNKTDVKEHIISHLVGHSNEKNMTRDIYTDTPTSDILREALMKVYSNKFNWSHIQSEVRKIDLLNEIDEDEQVKDVWDVGLLDLPTKLI